MWRWTLCTNPSAKLAGSAFKVQPQSDPLTRLSGPPVQWLSSHSPCSSLTHGPFCARRFIKEKVSSCHSTAQNPPVTPSDLDATTACDPFWLRCNHRVWLPRGLSWLIACPVPWSPCLSWNQPHPLLPLFADAVLPCVSFFSSTAQSLVSFSRALLSVTFSDMAWKRISPPHAPNQQALSILLFSGAPSPDIYICLSVLPLFPSAPATTCKLHKSRDLVLLIVTSPETGRVPDSERGNSQNIPQISEQMNDWMDGGRDDRSRTHTCTHKQIRR